MMRNNSAKFQLEAWREPQNEVRLTVCRWCIAEPVGAQFIEKTRSVRIVWNCLQRIGLVAVLRKIRSRIAEGQRNQKIAGIGIGEILESPPKSGFMAGQRVLFLHQIIHCFLRAFAWMSDCFSL